MVPEGVSVMAGKAWLASRNRKLTGCISIHTQEAEGRSREQDDPINLESPPLVTNFHNVYLFQDSTSTLFHNATVLASFMSTGHNL